MDFSDLDDLLFDTSSDGLMRIESELMGTAFSGLGPLIEYEFARTSGLARLPATPSKSWAAIGLPIGLKSINRPASTSTNPLCVEIVRTPISGAECDSPLWSAFCKRLHGAGRDLGLSRTLAGGITAALGELVSNIIEHSENTATGVLGYRATSNTFEFVVGDCGIGVLQSLRKSKFHCAVSTDSRALQLALADGVSRHESRQRGYGFRHLFLSFADHGARLRFRSGTASIKLRDAADGLSRGISFQTFRLRGFLVSGVWEI